VEFDADIIVDGHGDVAFCERGREVVGVGRKSTWSGKKLGDCCLPADELEAGPIGKLLAISNLHFAARVQS
jgi:hypothetical protein